MDVVKTTWYGIENHEYAQALKRRLDTIGAIFTLFVETFGIKPTTQSGAIEWAIDAGLVTPSEVGRKE